MNLRGKFNVPIGTKTSVRLDSDDFGAISQLLNNATIEEADFETTINQARDEDFIFVDPPYITRHNFNGFVKYNDKIFSWTDQQRLAKSVKRAAARGAKILVTNADHETVRRLYHGIGKKLSVERQSVLAAGASNRGKTTELAITINYTPVI